MAPARLGDLLPGLERALGLPLPALLSGHGVLERAGSALRRLGGAPLLLVGREGYPRVAASLAAALESAGLPVRTRLHQGLCSGAAVAAHLRALGRDRPDAVVAVGGGRVLDTGKLLAERLGVPVACIPTSAATCAAVTRVSVPYDPSGACLGGVTLARMPELVVLELDVLARAPARLLAAGIVDAEAKWHEVRLAARLGASSADSSAEPSPELAAALALCERLHALLRQHAEAALEACTSGRPSPALDAVLEAVIVLPGLASALAGPANRIAVAHAVHNLATCYPYQEDVLHGELVGFGVLCQMLLDGAAEGAVRSEAAWYRRMGLPLGLAEMGFAPGALEALAEDVAGSSTLQTFFPSLDATAVQRAVRGAERLAVISQPESRCA